MNTTTQTPENLYEAVKSSRIFEDESFQTIAEELFTDQHNDLLQIASDLTDMQHTQQSYLGEKYDYSVSQVGNYQFWRDRTEVAIVDTNANRLVTYGLTEVDLYPQQIENPHLLSENKDPNLQRLKDKMLGFNPRLDLQYDRQTTTTAYEEISSLDPYRRAEKIHGSKSLSTVSKKFLTGMQDFVERFPLSNLKASFKNGIVKIKEKAEATLLKFSAKRLMKLSHHKFEEAYSKTKEDIYTIGDYYITKDSQSRYELLDSENKLVSAFKLDCNGKLDLLHSNGDLVATQKALKSIPEQDAVGCRRLADEYRNQVVGLSKKLLELEDGTQFYEDARAYLVKVDNQNILLRDDKGKYLISIREKAIEKPNISAKQLEQIGDRVDHVLKTRQQQRDISNAAKTLESYFRLKKETTVDKDNLIARYNPRKNIISYQGKNASDCFLAQKVRGKWQDIGQNSYLSPDKVAYFQQAEQKIQRSQDSQIRKPLQR